MDNRKLASSENNSPKKLKKVNENQSLLSSTASTLQSFKSALRPRLHSDGIGIGSLDFRLRHIPDNLVYLSKETITAIILLLHLAEGEARGPKPPEPPQFIGFYDSHLNTRYAVTTTLRLISVIEKIKAGICNVTITSGGMSDKYDLIKTWDSDVSLWRGRNNTLLNDVETCLENMIQIDFDAFLQSQKEFQNLHIFVSCGIAGGIFIIFIFILMVCLLPRRSLLDMPSHTDVSEMSDHEVDMDENLRRIPPTTTISPELAQKLKEIEESGPKHHYEERLKKIGYDLDKVPKDFLDPVFYFIMDNPVVVRDGFSVDDSTVTAALKGNPNAKCIIDRGFKLNDVIIPNHSLKNAIEAFVTKKELKQTLKQNVKEEIIIEIEKGTLSASQEILFAKNTESSKSAERMEEVIESKDEGLASLKLT